MAALSFLTLACSASHDRSGGDAASPAASPRPPATAGGTGAPPGGPAVIPPAGDDAPVADTDAPMIDDDVARDPGGRAYVASVEVLVLESFPLQVRVAVAGQLSDPCTRLAEPRVRRADTTFHVELPTTRGPGLCAQVLVPFEETVTLDVHGLPKGTYTVDVEGKTATFTFDRDNTFGRP
jgi:inhibitor of cysteine peptidase